MTYPLREKRIQIQAVAVREARLRLCAAIRRLTPLEHPSGYRATHEGPELLASAKKQIAEAVRILDDM